MNHNFEDCVYFNEFNQLLSNKWNYYTNSQKINLLQHIGDKYSESRGLAYSPEIFPEGREGMLGGFDGRRIFINLGSCQNPYEALYTLIHEENHAVMGNSLANNMHDYYTSEELSLLRSEDETYKDSGFAYYVQSLEQECNNRAARFVMGYSDNYASDPAYGIFLDGLQKEYNSYSRLYDENYERSTNSEKKQIDEAYNKSSINSNEVFAAEIYLNNNRIKNEMSHIHEQIENEKGKNNDNMFNDLKEQCEFDSQNVFRTDRYENYFNEYFENKKSFSELLGGCGNDDRSKEYYSLLNKKADIASMYKFNELKLSSAESNPELSQNCQRMIEYIKGNMGLDYSNMNQLDFDAFEGIDEDHGSLALGGMTLNGSGSQYYSNYSDADGLDVDVNNIEDEELKESGENIEDESTEELEDSNNLVDVSEEKYEEDNPEYFETGIYSEEKQRDDMEDSEDLAANDENSDLGIYENDSQTISDYSVESLDENLEDSEEMVNESTEDKSEIQDNEYENSDGLVSNDQEASDERVNTEMQNDLNLEEETAEELAEDKDNYVDKLNDNNQLYNNTIDNSMISDFKANEGNANNRSNYNELDSENASDLVDEKNSFSNNQNDTLDNSVDIDSEQRNEGEDSVNTNTMNSDEYFSNGETSNSTESYSGSESLGLNDTSANNNSESVDNTYSR